jgi:hypothetical protein
MKIFQVILFCFLLFSLANAHKINGSFGGLYTQDSQPLYGAFLEINNTQFGGYLSISGNNMGSSHSNISYTMFDLGPTYFRNWIGVSLLVGVYNTLEQRLTLPNNSPPLHGYYDKPYGGDDGGFDYDFISNNYIFYSCNFILYPIKYFTLNVGVSYIPKLKEVYIKTGIGPHFL